MGGSVIEATAVRLQKLHEKAQVPEYKSDEAAGADLFAAFDGPAIEIPAGGRVLIPTGIAIELQTGTEAQVRPRSGLAVKFGLTVLNTPGTIDSDYRGEIKVLLLNTSDKAYYVNTGERIAQLVIAPIYRGEFVEAESLNDTDRGEGGFGSTGQ